MDADRYGRVFHLFDRACDLTEPEKEEFLREACGGDAELREWVDLALVEAERSSRFLESSPCNGLLSNFQSIYGVPA